MPTHRPFPGDSPSAQERDWRQGKSRSSWWTSPRGRRPSSGERHRPSPGQKSSAAGAVTAETVTSRAQMTTHGAGRRKENKTCRSPSWAQTSRDTFLPGGGSGDCPQPGAGRRLLCICRNSQNYMYLKGAGLF